MNKINAIFRNLFPVIASVLLLVSVSGCGKKPQPAASRLSINTAPAKATVTIRGREIGETPIKMKVKPDIYLVKLSLPGYKNNWQKIEMKPGDQKNLTFPLEKETASVMITSEPDAAAVNFQGRNLGVTPVVIKDLPHGSYTAELTRHGFNPQTVSWIIDSPLPQLVKCSLDSNLGTLIISSVPANAEVVMDGKPLGRTPYRDQVEEGRHEIELRRNGYVSLKKSVHVKSRAIVRMDKMVLEVKPGSIQVNSKPSGARIIINGKNYGDTPFKISNLKPGSYLIRLEREGHDPAIRKVNLPAGENLDLMFNLDSNTGGVDIVTHPAGITLYLDGKRVGITEKDPRNRNISKVFSIRNLSMGNHRLTIAHKRARPEKRNISFTVRKGQVVRLANASLWIPNAILTRTNGARETGRIIQDLPNKYEFEPLPGVKYTVEKTTVKKVELLPEVE